MDVEYGSSLMLYASTESETINPSAVDANSYPPFKMLDSTIIKRIENELDQLDTEEESSSPSVGQYLIESYTSF